MVIDPIGLGTTTEMLFQTLWLSVLNLSPTQNTYLFTNGDKTSLSVCLLWWSCCKSRQHKIPEATNLLLLRNLHCCSWDFSNFVENLKSHLLCANSDLSWVCHLISSQNCKIQNGSASLKQMRVFWTRIEFSFKCMQLLHQRGICLF